MKGRKTSVIEGTNILWLSQCKKGQSSKVRKSVKATLTIMLALLVPAEPGELTFGAERAIRVMMAVHGEHTARHRWRSVASEIGVHLACLLLLIMVEHQALRFWYHVQVHGRSRRHLVELLH